MGLGLKVDGKARYASSSYHIPFWVTLPIEGLPLWLLSISFGVSVITDFFVLNNNIK